MPVTAQPRDFSAPPASSDTHPDADEGPDARKPVAWPTILRVLSTYKSADRDLKAGEHLFTVGEPCEAIHVLVRGWAYVFSPLADGRQIIFQFGLPGTVIGFHPEPNATAACSARALTDATAHVVSYDQLSRLFRDNPDMAVRLTALLSQDRKLAFDRLTSTCRHSARRRVSQLLLELALQGWPFAPRVGAQNLFIPVTQEHLADATGLSTVHVNRVLSTLRRERIVEFQHRRLRILSFTKLRAAAGGDEPTERGASGPDVGPPGNGTR
jgi:CRP/FNR family transcriptional regulator, anaerobic regulatory protein